MMKRRYFCIALLAIFCACSGKKDVKTESKQELTRVIREDTVDVKVSVLKEEDFNFELISNGTASARSKAEIRFLSQENIAAIYVKNGQFVRKGEKLAELDRFKLEIALAQAEETMERVELDMRDGLIGQGYSILDMENIPEQAFKLAKIRSNYEQTHNNLRIAKYNLEAATLYAPFNGVIANLTARPHNLSGNDPFCLLIDDQQMEVVFHILENELHLLSVNDKVVVSPFSRDHLHVSGRVSEINPLIDKNGMVRITALVPNSDHLFKEGMNVKVVVQRLLSRQLIIPKPALVLRSGKKVVFTMKEGKSVWNYVETGEENSTGYVVTSGLQVGDSVIWDGNMNLAHDVAVNVIP